MAHHHPSIRVGKAFTSFAYPATLTNTKGFDLLVPVNYSLPNLLTNAIELYSWEI